MAIRHRFLKCIISRAGYALHGTATAIPSTPVFTGSWGHHQKAGCTIFGKRPELPRGRKFIDLDEYFRVEDSSGRTLVFYTDIDRLEKHLLEFSPQDEKPIREFINGIRLCLPFDSLQNTIISFTTEKTD